MPSTRIAVLTATSVVTLLLTAACGSSGGGGSSSGAAPGAGKGSGAATTAAATDAAGSSGGGGGGGGAQVDLCTVLTTAQIQQAIGVPVGPGTKSEQPAVGCGWMDPNIGNNSGVVLMYVDPAVYDGTKNANGQNGVTITAVSGVGDEAFIESLSPSTKPLLMIKKGSRIVSLSAEVRANGSGDTDPAKDVAAEKQLAAIVVSAL